MRQGLLLIETAPKRKPNLVAVPTLLVALEPWHRVFLRNLRDLFRFEPKPALRVVSRPAPFWPDVFVASWLPWNRFLQSAFCHIVAIAALSGWARLWQQRPQIVERPVFHNSDVIYYDASEYLPPLNTGGTDAPSPKGGDPVYAPQSIVSVPPQADNRTQTIVAPLKLQLDREVPLPNIAALGQPRPVIPTAVAASSLSDVKLPALPSSVVAPTPDMNQTAMKPAPALAESVVAPAPEVDAAVSRREVRAPRAAVVEPPPQVQDAASRRLSDIDIAHAAVVAPAPQLPMGEQRAIATAAPLGVGETVVPPPPSVQGSAGANDGRLIALNLHPVTPSAPVGVPAGSRLGTFAATPEGKADAAGTVPVDNRRTASRGELAGSGGNTDSIPSGLLVGKAPARGSTVPVAGATPGSGSNARLSENSRLLASATPPRASAVPRSSELPANALSELERSVFAGRKSYAMTLNVPNLNSAGGSWVMHFAEMKDSETQGELVAPLATQAVDPGYPLELMRQNVQGTVTLSAVIRSDGSVGDVRILRGVDDRLDAYATTALLRWRFRPATKNGEAVALQAVVMIPFRLRKTGF